jgi:hypothetical protein
MLLRPRSEGVAAGLELLSNSPLARCPVEMLDAVEAYQRPGGATPAKK